VGTVHLTLRESIHEKLREYAAEMGVSVTDLIKMFIQEGLKRLEKERAERLRRKNAEATEMLVRLVAKIESLEKIVEEKFTIIEGDLYRLRTTVNSLRKRVEELEDLVEEKVFPSVEPELISS